jgi:hypothetical protein
MVVTPTGAKLGRNGSSKVKRDSDRMQARAAAPNPRVWNRWNWLDALVAGE